LDVTTSAAALVLQTSPAARGASSEEQARLADHILGAGGSGGRAHADATVKEIVQRMTLHSVVWVTLGYSSATPAGYGPLASFATLRTAHLRVLAGETSTVLLRTTLQMLAAELDERTVFGTLAHAVAISAAPSEEMGVSLWCRAADQALDSGFGSSLTVELCLGALLYCHGFPDPPVAAIVAFLCGLTSDQPPRTRLVARLASLDGESRSTMALCLVNTSSVDAVAPSHAASLVEAAAGLATPDDQGVYDEIQEILAVDKLRRAIPDGVEIDMRETLAQWEKWRHRNHYAFVVNLLLRHASEGDKPMLVGTGIRYLAEHPESPRFSGTVHLALTMARHLNTQRDLAQAASAGADDDWMLRSVVSYAARVHPAWEWMLTIEDNIAITQFFIQYRRGDVRRHRERLAQWEVDRQQRDALEKLPALIRDGKYFMVLWHFVSTLFGFGLATDPAMPLAVFDDVAHQANALAEWQSGEDRVPPAVCRVAGDVRLSAKFFRYGRALFGYGADSPDLAESRQLFNDAAQAALPTVLAVLARLPGIPKALQTLLEDHRRQFGDDR
jgi:hypothetical protein